MTQLIRNFKFLLSLLFMLTILFCIQAGASQDPTQCMNLCNEAGCKKEATLLKKCKKWCGLGQENLLEACKKGSPAQTGLRPPAENCMNLCNEDGCKKDATLLKKCKKWCGPGQENLLETCKKGSPSKEKLRPPAENCMNLCNENNCKQRPNVLELCKKWCGRGQENLLASCEKGSLTKVQEEPKEQKSTPQSEPVESKQKSESYGVESSTKGGAEETELKGQKGMPSPVVEEEPTENQIDLAEGLVRELGKTNKNPTHEEMVDYIQKQTGWPREKGDKILRQFGH